MQPSKLIELHEELTRLYAHVEELKKLLEPQNDPKIAKEFAKDTELQLLPMSNEEELLTQTSGLLTVREEPPAITVSSIQKLALQW